MASLTDRQKAFVVEYLVDFNATQAAIRAGYSAKSATQMGSTLRARGAVAQAIQEAQAQRENRTRITADRVVAELAHIAFGDVRSVADWGPDGLVLRESSALSEAEAATVAEVYESVTRDGGTKKVKQHDKLKALDLLGRHLGMWEKREIPIDDGEITLVRIVVEDARAEEHSPHDSRTHTPE